MENTIAYYFISMASLIGYRQGEYCFPARIIRHITSQAIYFLKSARSTYVDPNVFCCNFVAQILAKHNSIFIMSILKITVVYAPKITRIR